MKKTFALILAALTLAACNFNLNGVNVGNGKRVVCKGPVVQKTLDLADFNAITVNGAADMEISQGTQFKVAVKANEEVFQHLDYKVEDGVLILETIEHVNIKAEEFDIYITLPLLKDLTVNGAADVDIKSGYSAADPLSIIVNGAGDLEFSGITVPSLNFELNGAGDIEASALQVDQLNVSVNGAGDIELSGKAGKASFDVNGAGDIDARALECSEIVKSKSGLARIRTK